MRIGFARPLIALALGLPLLAGVGDRLRPRGADDPVLAAGADPVRSPLARKAGDGGPASGVPCRRSAADPLDEAPPVKHGRSPNTGCNLRLVKRQPADARIWV